MSLCQLICVPYVCLHSTIVSSSIVIDSYIKARETKESRELQREEKIPVDFSCGEEIGNGERSPAVSIPHDGEKRARWRSYNPTKENR